MVLEHTALFAQKGFSRFHLARLRSFRRPPTLCVKLRTQDASARHSGHVHAVKLSARLRLVGNDVPLVAYLHCLAAIVVAAACTG